MKSTNIPEVKLGIVAVSRDCFPIQLSEKRRAAIVAACQAKGLDLYEAKTTVENLSLIHISALNSCVCSPAHWPVRWKPSSTKFTPAKPCWCCRTKSTATAPLANLRACYGCFLPTGCQNLFLSWASGSLSPLCSAWKLRP